MDIQAEKNELAKLILSTNDLRLINQIKALFKNEEDNWWEKLPESVQSEINHSIQQADSTEFTFYNEIKREVVILLKK
jgi:hypothetical protein